MAGISRRVVLGSGALAATGAWLPGGARGAPAGAYPPAATGMRGAHDGSFEVAHALAREGARWPRPREQTDAAYDLVVVGAGLSGLAAAWFHQQARPGARVLLLDNHDDFGGHARRNEFLVDGQRLIGYGGSQNIDTPAGYSAVAAGLLRDLGIQPERFGQWFDTGFNVRHGLQDALQLPGHALAANPVSWFNSDGPAAAAARAAALALPAADRQALGILLDPANRLPGGQLPEAARVLLQTPRRVPALDFLRALTPLPAAALAVLQRKPAVLWGTGLDALSIREAVLEGLVGEGLAELAWGVVAQAPADRLYPDAPEQPYIFHFPDGNATLARSLVRALVPGALPGALPGQGVEGLVTANLDYRQLDRAGAVVRVRLQATAVDVRNRAGGVDVTYRRHGRSERVRARRVVLACQAPMVPWLCPEAGGAQRDALAWPERAPFALVNVALRHWRPLAASGFGSLYAPDGFLTLLGLDFPVSIGDYRFSPGPDAPVVLQGWHVPAPDTPGLEPRARFRAGRHALVGMALADFERAVLEQLDAAWGVHGLDVQRDVAAITVNRWPHGYAYEYMDLWDDHAWGRGAGPHVRARQQLGNIAIANSDTEAHAYVDGAVDAAYRAVRELLG